MSTLTHVYPTSDDRLGWRAEHDARSFDYPIRAALPMTIEDRPKQWLPGVVLNQGREGSCVGHAWTGELIGSPKPDNRVTADRANRYAFDLYRAAQRVDEWPGESPTYEGTSVLAGAKIVQSRSLIGEYRWAFSVEDVRDAVLTEGPVVIGIPWYSAMYNTRPSGLVEVDGSLVGGHALLVYGYHPGMRINGEDWNTRYRVFRWRNSWSTAYGRNGSGLIRYEDLRDLLKGWGEACVPVNRKSVRL
jgi:hypothetical protein